MTESKANEAAGAADYATAYGKPPPITRFRQGQSAIPQGGKGAPRDKFLQQFPMKLTRPLFTSPRRGEVKT
jgi:hypothetical protein